jgi:hypothetical protein
VDNKKIEAVVEVYGASGKVNVKPFEASYIQQ